MKISSSCVLTCLGLVLVSPRGMAVPVPPDLVIIGTMEMDAFFGTFTEIQTGTFFAREGGLDTIHTFVGPPGDVLPNDSVTGILTDHGGGVVGAGDGFGITYNLSADSAPGDLDGEGVTDLFLGAGGGAPMTVINTSASVFYRVDFSVAYDHDVNAGGADHFVESDLEIEMNGIQLFEAEIISDTFVGNSINKVSAPGFGGLVEDDGVFTDSVTVAPGNTVNIGLDYTGNADAFAPDGTGAATADIFLSLDNIVVVIPEPNTLSLVVLGLATTKLFRKKLRNK